MGIGAALSNVTSGYVVQWFGYATDFLYLAAIAGCALAFFALLMPETKTSDSEEPARPDTARSAVA